MVAVAVAVAAVVEAAAMVAAKRVVAVVTNGFFLTENEHNRNASAPYHLW